LENSDDIVKIGTLMGSMGYIKEAQEILEAVLLRKPNDTTALNNYGYVLLHEIIQSKKNFKGCDY
jgi:Tfp pilus assembly protein PilF